MDWMGLEKIEKKFDLFVIQTHPIPLNPHGLRANRTSPKWGFPKTLKQTLPWAIGTLIETMIKRSCKPYDHGLGQI
jgi:hypothetical protein